MDILGRVFFPLKFLISKAAKRDSQSYFSPFYLILLQYTSPPGGFLLENYLFHGTVLTKKKMTLAVTKKQPNRERLWPSSLQYHICPRLHAAFKNAAATETHDPFPSPNQAMSTSCCRKITRLLDLVSLLYFCKTNSHQRIRERKAVYRDLGLGAQL